MTYYRNIHISDPTTLAEANIKRNLNTSSCEILVNLEGHQCSGNSTIEQLDANESFVGSEWQDTLDYGVVSISVSSDQNSALNGLDVQWSNDGISVFDHDYATILANMPKTFTFGPVERYYRVIYTNGSGGETTTFHLSSLLRRCYVKPSSHRISDSIVGDDDAELIKAVLTGEADDGIFYNVKVTKDGSQYVKLIDSQNNKEMNITPTRALKVITPVKLAGTNFNGTKDPNFWTETVTGTGSITLSDSQIILSTGTTADSTTKYETVRKGRFVASSANQFRGVVHFHSNPTENNIRRLGVSDPNNGYFFQLNGTAFQVVSRLNGVDTEVSNGSFNGKLGATYSLSTDVHRLNIDYTNISAAFYIDDELLHTISSNEPSSGTLTLPVTIENINTNGLTTDIRMDVRVAVIVRLGNLDSNPMYKFINTNTTTICKYGAGALQRIVNCDNAGSITIYDNITASGTIIAIIDTAKARGDLSFNAPFSNGLTIVSSGGAKVAIIYE